MERHPYCYPFHARKSTFAAKATTTIFSLATITVLVFAGSRDWKTDRSWMATMSDVSDIKALASKFSVGGDRAFKTAPAPAVTARSESATSLISTGLLQQQNKGGTAMHVNGMEKATAY